MNWILINTELHQKEKCKKCLGEKDYTVIYFGTTKPPTKHPCRECNGEGYIYTKGEPVKPKNYRTLNQKGKRYAEYHYQLSLANQLDAALKLIDLYDNGLTKDNCTQTPTMKLVRATARKLAEKTLSLYTLVDKKIVIKENVII